MANPKAYLLCDIDPQNMVYLPIGTAYTAGDMVKIGDRPVIILKDCTAAEAPTAVLKASRVKMDVAAENASATANFVAGQNVLYGGSAGAGLSGTGGDGTALPIGTCLIAGSKTAGTVISTFDSEMYVAAGASALRA